jgi:hypothetical protein
MTGEKSTPLVINGWTIFAHPLFLDQIEDLVRQVEAHKKKDSSGYKKNASKRLAAIAKLAFEVIPQDPTRPDYRQGDTRGDDYKHWFRVRKVRARRIGVTDQHRKPTRRFSQSSRDAVASLARAQLVGMVSIAKIFFGSHRKSSL